MGKVYANNKILYWFIVSTEGTIIEDLVHWIEYQLKELSRQHPAYLQDTGHFLSHIDEINKVHEAFEKEKLWLISRDTVNYYPISETETYLKAVAIYWILAVKTFQRDDVY